MQLEIKNLFKKYNNSEQWAVQDFNLTIEQKEFIVLLGPSGSGKLQY